MSYMDRIYKITTVEEAKKELARQREILGRQQESYRTARPKSRFAVASHITKTESKINRLTTKLLDLGVPFAEVMELAGLSEYV